MYKCRIKIVGKFVEKLLKKRIMFMDILTFFGRYYRIAWLIILFFVVPGINIPNIRSNG